MASDGTARGIDDVPKGLQTPDHGLLWVHLDYADLWTRRWVTEQSGLDPVIGEALLETETRPRCVPHHDGLMVILRGVNLNPRSDPEDMVSIRLWIEERRVITLRHRRLMAVQELREAAEKGEAPRDAGEFLVRLCAGMLEKMAPVMADLDDEVDALEDEVLTTESYELRAKIGGLRRQAIRMRRYLAPQRDVITRLQGEQMRWLNDQHRMHLRELSDRTIRHVEDLDSVRDRAAVSQDELNSRLSEQMNKTMYVLSIVAAIFLPLGLLTGLLGINVGGIPGTESPVAFTVVCVMLLVVAIIQAWLFRKMRWI
jgi:zinc transporter